jgi:hypothetical protein
MTHPASFIWFCSGCLAIAASAACGPAQPGRASSYVIVRSFEAASGARPGEFSATLASDVVTLVSTTIDGEQVRVPTRFEDTGRVTFVLAMKEPDREPAPANFVTFQRYRVTYARADGRNQPGVDVPYSFDGALTVTVTGEPVSTSLTLVRAQAKDEPPLRQLAAGGGARAVATIAEVTFYGHDQAGRGVTAVAAISIHFADWGDPN